MNLKIYLVKTINRLSFNQYWIVNTAYMNNIKQNGTDTDFLLRYNNFQKLLTVDAQYDNVRQDVEDYNSGTKIQIPVSGIDNDDVNETLTVNVDTIVHGWNDEGYTKLLIADRPVMRKYKTTDSLSGIETKALHSSGLGEKHIMTVGQTSITTTGIITNYHKLYLNGSIQGIISELSDWTVSGANALTYSGDSFYGGEQIFLIL